MRETTDPEHANRNSPSTLICFALQSVLGARGSRFLSGSFSHGDDIFSPWFGLLSFFELLFLLL